MNSRESWICYVHARKGRGLSAEPNQRPSWPVRKWIEFRAWLAS